MPKHQKISQDILDVLSHSERVLFTGWYNLSDRNLQCNVSTIPMTLDINLCGYNVLVDIYTPNQDKSKPPVQLTLRNETISSFDSTNVRIGQISTVNVYIEPRNTANVTNPSIQVFDVQSASGIYKNVKKVIIDYRLEPRYVYFVGKC